jgi:hypothetical protein
VVAQVVTGMVHERRHDWLRRCRELAVAGELRFHFGTPKSGRGCLSNLPKLCLYRVPQRRNYLQHKIGADV